MSKLQSPPRRGGVDATLRLRAIALALRARLRGKRSLRGFLIDRAASPPVRGLCEEGNILPKPRLPNFKTESLPSSGSLHRRQAQQPDVGSKARHSDLGL